MFSGMLKNTAAALLIFLSLAAPAAGGDAASAVPRTYFGMHIHRLDAGTSWPSVPVGSFRLWDTYVGWAWLEPKKGEWNFAKLDRLVAESSAHGADLLLPLGLTPAWASARPQESSNYAPGLAAEPRSLDDWRTYVRTVATRYKGRIRYYEIWNEPNLPGFFSGSTEKMVELARIARETVRSIDPTAQIVSPAAAAGDRGVRWLGDFLSKGGGETVDIIGFHFYTSPGPPENMVPLIRNVREVMKKYRQDRKPLWNTETGWFIASAQKPVTADASGFRSKVLGPGEASGYVARSLVLAQSEGVDRFYWYSWDSGLMGLVEPDGRTVKEAGDAFGRIVDWLVGRSVDRCFVDDTKTWTCQMTIPGGRRGWLLWNTEREMSMRVPRIWGATTMKRLDGSETRTPATITIGPTPLLLETIRR